MILFARRLILSFFLFIYFLKEVILANLQIAQLVLWRPERLRPALIKVPLDLETERGLFLLATMITLTPGTLSLDISPQKDFLYVHVTHTQNPDQVVQDIKQGFEKKLRELGC
jgi:multisubunit Na+/H+ antiporter MnhE subunit